VRSGVYAIENAINGKVYVGSSVDVLGRCREHRRLLLLGKHTNRHLQFSWTKYGGEAFRFRLLERCSTASLIGREQHHIDTRNRSCLYNICLIAGTTLGQRLSPEACKNISASKMGIPHTLEHNAAIGNAHRGMKHHHTLESMAKLRILQTGRKYDDATKEKMRAAKLGRNWSVVDGKRVWSQPCQL
jgi:group I intron endonuclease